ncbi:DUF5359 family protein [Radiobacillus deserti]|uniref:Uncharacterized protein n=1 Tax=Radiobacillus deserti TaxID=2594883 RepID=A0A516KGH7_9BACI|nr:DUF5359 family protein [Radiobacillus deserti]QDP40479.1 hypothetical protein FN924_09945 [Radiobacillus deserti]
MKRVERWCLSLLFLHGLLLIFAQLLISQSDFELYTNPVFEYIGVNEQGNANIVKTIDSFFSDVLSF